MPDVETGEDIDSVQCRKLKERLSAMKDVKAQGKPYFSISEEGAKRRHKIQEAPQASRFRLPALFSVPLDVDLESNLAAKKSHVIVGVTVLLLGLIACLLLAMEQQQMDHETIRGLVAGKKPQHKRNSKRVDDEIARFQMGISGDSTNYTHSNSSATYINPEPSSQRYSLTADPVPVQPIAVPGNQATTPAVNPTVLPTVHPAVMPVNPAVPAGIPAAVPAGIPAAVPAGIPVAVPVNPLAPQAMVQPTLTLYNGTKVARQVDAQHPYLAENQRLGTLLPQIRPDGTPVNPHRAALPIEQIKPDNKLLTNYLVHQGVDPLQAMKMGTFPPNSPKAPPPFPPYPPFLPPPSPPPIPPYAPAVPARPPAFPSNPITPPSPNMVVQRLANYLPAALHTAAQQEQQQQLGYGAMLALQTNQQHEMLALQQAQQAAQAQAVGVQPGH